MRKKIIGLILATSCLTLTNTFALTRDNYLVSYTIQNMPVAATSPIKISFKGLAETYTLNQAYPKLPIKVTHGKALNFTYTMARPIIGWYTCQVSISNGVLLKNQQVVPVHKHSCPRITVQATGKQSWSVLFHQTPY